MENDTCLQIYGGTQPPHIFCLFVMDKELLNEVSYQTDINGIGVALVNSKKDQWPPFTLING